MTSRHTPTRPRSRGRVASWLVLAAGIGMALAASWSGSGHDHRAHAHQAPPAAAGPAGAAAAAADRPDAAQSRPVHEHGGGHHGGTGAHGDSEGVKLVAASGESVTEGGGCTADAPERAYELAAIAVDITLNRYLDHDPEGRMYVLTEDVEAVRAEEEANAAARSGSGDPAVSIGLQGDAIQPLTLRVLPGECLRLSLENRLEDEPASLHLHGSSLRVAATGDAATAANPEATAAPGEAVEYEWMVPSDEPEATHHFHSHGVERAQTNHGLFGAVIVEPPGSRWSDPVTGESIETGWQAVIEPPGARPFREFAVYYHEIGNEDERLLDGGDKLVEVVDPFTSAYRPGARALNYRSEPFMNRLALAQERGRRADESLEYSSYSFGDPATPMLRTYRGDPIKQRVVHGGSEVFHVHHVHGGTTRWPRQPGTPGTVFGSGLDKHPASVPERSSRTDSQSLGPSESFDIETECGGGGCQFGAGDFMYHCHVGHHYFAGMWGIARTYNTLQDGSASTDGLPALRPLPGADDDPAPAVPSDALVGTSVDPGTGSVTVTSETLSDIVEPQLPPAGEPADGSAAVFDWVRRDDRYLNEPETEESWPGYTPSEPGRRPPLLFDPDTGRLAYPMLRPHFGKRPPFAPGHGPAPFLDPAGNGRDPPPPGVSGPASLCPDGTRPREFAINAIRTPIFLNEEEHILDPTGMLFVLRSQRDRVADERDLQVPLALRTNAGVDCVDVLLRSELKDDGVTPFSKVGIHIHFVQFDVQASDGVNVGFNYEQTVRPYAQEGALLTAPVAAGERTLQVDDAERFREGALVGVGMDRDEGFEVAAIADVRDGELVLAEPLRHAHAADEHVSTEFVRYRWYPDAQFGTAYFHDHVDALTTWRHGLFGALVAEPADATWTHPTTGEPLPSGPVADVHTEQPVGHDVRGSFRELLLFTQDDNPLAHIDRSPGGTFNLRIEPLEDRADPPELQFSSDEHGDPETPVVRAHLGDPVVIRDLVGAANEVHTLHVDGHWFRAERFSPTSPPIAAVDVGISERYDLVIPAAGGPQRMPGDYVYENGRFVKLLEGNWGLLRVLPPGAGGLQPLPDAQPVEPPEGVCPADAPVRSFEVAAVEAPLPMLGDEFGAVYVPLEQAVAVEAGDRIPHPLVLRATVGDCLEISLTNRLDSGRVSLRSDLLARDPAGSAGIAAGHEPDQSVPAGDTGTYTLYASPEVGETVAVVRDGADATTNPGRGLYGAIVIAADGARFRDPASGQDLGSAGSSWHTEVLPEDDPSYRDYVLFLQDEDPSLGTHRMPYTVAPLGTTAVNYRTEPLDGRSIATAVAEGPSTPVLEAEAGERLRIHVVAPWSEQAQVFSLEGHTWPQEPGLPGTPQLSSQRIGGLQTRTLYIPSAGGPEALPGEYLYGNHRVPYEQAGAWGILRVRPAADAPASPSGAAPSGGGVPLLPMVLLVVAGAAVAAVAAIMVRGGRRARR